MCLEQVGNVQSILPAKGRVLLGVGGGTQNEYLDSGSLEKGGLCRGATALLRQVGLLQLVFQQRGANAACTD